jgi:PBSX family phage terminase large subunit
MVAKAVFKDDARIAYIAPTYQQARDIAWNELKKICLPVQVLVNESRLEITVKTKNGGTSIISLRGWESIETLRGQAFDFIVIDEIASMRNFFLNWQEVIRPTLTDRRGHVLFISTPKGFNHFYDLFNVNDVDYKSFHFTTYDNPHLPVDEIDKAKVELPEDRFAQEYMADFRKMEGLVFKEFSRDRHVKPSLPSDVVIVDTLGGIDFGFTNPCGVAHIHKDSKGRYWIVDEWYKTGRTENQVADYVASCNFNSVYPDPENPSAITVIAQRGVNVVEVSKGKGSIVTGNNVIRQLFRSNKLFVLAHCRNTITELESYAYPEKKKDGVEPEIPEDVNNHLISAIRYTLLTKESLTTSGVSQMQHDFFTRNEYNYRNDSTK